MSDNANEKVTEEIPLQELSPQTPTVSTRTSNDNPPIKFTLARSVDNFMQQANSRTSQQTAVNLGGFTKGLLTNAGSLGIAGIAQGLASSLPTAIMAFQSAKADRELKREMWQRDWDAAKQLGLASPSQLTMVTQTRSSNVSQQHIPGSNNF